MSDAILCKQCGKREVEGDRRCYVTPVCYACLPPPPPLSIKWPRTLQLERDLAKALEALLVFVQLHAPTPEARQRHDEDERGWNMALHGAVDLAIRVLLQSEHEARVRETVKQAAWEHLYRDEAEP